MLFTIQLINLFLCISLEYKNLKFKYLINDISTDFLSLCSFTMMKNIKKTSNLLSLSQWEKQHTI